MNSLLERRRVLPRSLDEYWNDLQPIMETFSFGHRNLVRRCLEQVLGQFALPYNMSQKFSCKRSCDRETTHSATLLAQYVESSKTEFVDLPHAALYILHPCCVSVLDHVNMIPFNEVHVTASIIVHVFNRHSHLPEILSPWWEVARVNLGEADSQLNLQ